MKEKITRRDLLVEIRLGYREKGIRVGYTSGVFDLLHAGHVEYLEDARSYVDVLVVGVNSDTSVQANKGPLRPIVGESERAEVVAGLSCVDHVFIFDERNNNTNVRLLEPDVYVKAGDYSESSLTSKAIVEGYGGQVQIVPLRAGLSSSELIRRIETIFRTSEGEVIQHERRPAIFVDRDGTINEHIEYLSDPGSFVEIPGSFAALGRLKEKGFRIVVVTNQAGIGLGYFSKEDFFAVNREMMRQATAAGVSIDKIYFCPHSKADNCRCRKPSPFLLERAERELNVDLAKSFMIGDMSSDIECGRAAGCTSVLVGTGRGGTDGLFTATPDITAPDLARAADLILAQAA